MKHGTWNQSGRSPWQPSEEALPQLLWARCLQLSRACCHCLFTFLCCLFTCSFASAMLTQNNFLWVIHLRFQTRRYVEAICCVLVPWHFRSDVCPRTGILSQHWQQQNRQTVLRVRCTSRQCPVAFPFCFASLHPFLSTKCNVKNTRNTFFFLNQ